MTKREFIDLVAVRISLTKRDSERAMDAVFQTLAEVLAQGGRLRVHEFGVFDTRMRAPRRARNPHTGAIMHLDALKVPVLRPNKVLLRRLNDTAAQGKQTM